MAELKTKQTDQSVAAFFNEIADEQTRQDCWTISNLMQEVTQAEPKMWGSSIVGFASYHYTYASGRTGDWPLIGFAPRKRNLTLYITSGFDAYDALLQRLGKYTSAKSCLYIKRVSDVDLAVLKELFRQSVEHMRAKA